MSSPVFILSTARTGTQFFEDYINRTTGDALCIHEPRPSRIFKFLSNLYLNHRISDSLIINTYRWSRKKIFRKAGDRLYIESSNLIFGCIPSLNKSYSDIRIIHIVRHPVSYVKSHLGHGFWRGHKKFFARHVPYWMENVDVTDPSDPVELLSARWNYVNRQVQSYSDTNRYMRVRFEDLFSREIRKSSGKLNQIREFCGLTGLGENANAQWLQNPKNYSRRKQVLEPSQVEYIIKNNSQLMKEYHYID